MTSVGTFTLLYVVNTDFSPSPNNLYLVSASAQDVYIDLPPNADFLGQPAIFKRVDSSGHTVWLVAATGELVNGMAQFGISQQGEGGWLWPGAPAGAAAGAGWEFY